MPDPCPICRVTGPHKMSCPVRKNGATDQIAKLVRLFRRHTFCFADEDELQQGIAVLLKDSQITIGFVFHREYHLDSRSRVDFFEPQHGIALEVKVDGSTSDVTRQLHRYAQNAAVRAIVLVTTRQRHRAVARELGGKPVTVVTLTESML